MKPYYTDSTGTIRLFHGDAEAVMAELHAAGERFDLIFTSPPYNLGKSTGGGVRQRATSQARSRWFNCPLRAGYQAHTDDLPLEEYELWQRRCIVAMWGLLTDRGALFYNHKPRVQGCRLWLPTALNPDLPLRQVVIWDRGSGMNFNVAYYVPCQEWLMVFARPGWRMRTQGASGVGDVWRITPDVGNPHPAPFPVSLPSRAMETTPPGPVCDPFCGSGSTLVAAKQHGRPAVGVDLSEAYLEMAAKRLSQEVLPLADVTPPLPLAAGSRTVRWRRQRERGKREAEARS